MDTHWLRCCTSRGMASTVKRILAGVVGAAVTVAVSPRVRTRAMRKLRAQDIAMDRFVGYVVLPVWLAAGFLDYVWHRRTKIETTTGLSESVMHTLMMAEAGPAVFGALFLKTTPGVLSMIVAAAILHEATAIWDVMFTSSRRPIRPIEQHIHTFLEAVPFCVAAVAVCSHWEEAQALVRSGADWKFRPRKPMLPDWYLAAVLSAFTLLGALPHAEELWRCYRAEVRGLVGVDSPECARELFGGEV